MGRKSKRKGKAGNKASRRAKGSQKTAERGIDDPTLSAPRPLAKSAFATAQPGFWDKRLARTRLTYRAVGFFLLVCVLLDLLLFLFFEFGLGKCYGILCLI